MTKKQLNIPGLDVSKAKRYSRTRLIVLMVSLAWSAAQMLWLSRNRRSARLKSTIARNAPDARLTAPGYFGAVTLLSWLASLPVGFLGGWLVERRFGLTRQRPTAWFGDQVKGLGLSLILQPLLLTGAWTLIRRRPRDWWLVISALAVPLSVLFGYIAPLLIMPIFNKFTPIENEDLVERVQNLSNRAGITPVSPVSVDMSRQTDKPNAFFAGIGSSKRIALSDTLLAKFDHDEIEGVIAHEMGHQAHGDIWRLTGLAAASMFALAWAASRVAPAAIRRSARASGVESIADEASFPTVALTLSLLGFMVAPIQSAVSRSIERRTDRYAINLTGNPAAYGRAMTKLAGESLADPDPPRIVVTMLYSHPPIAERIHAASMVNEVM